MSGQPHGIDRENRARADQTETVADPGERLDDDGLIHTSASIDRISGPFRRVLDSTIDVIRVAAPGASVYAYGSVTTGQATSPTSDVDILTIGLDDAVAGRLMSAGEHASTTVRCPLTQRHTGDGPSV